MHRQTGRQDHLNDALRTADSAAEILKAQVIGKASQCGIASVLPGLNRSNRHTR